MPKTVEQVAAEVEAMKAVTAERVESYNTRLRSVHDGVTSLRDRAEKNATNIRVISEGLINLKEDISDIKKDIKLQGEHFDRAMDKMHSDFDIGMDKIKEDWSTWILELSSKFKWAAGFLVTVVGLVLTLVLK